MSNNFVLILDEITREEEKFQTTIKQAFREFGLQYGPSGDMNDPVFKKAYENWANTPHKPRKTTFT